MKHLVQCPECGETNLKNIFTLEKFHCDDCSKYFDYELMHFVELTKNYDLKIKLKKLIKDEIKEWENSDLDNDTTDGAKTALSILIEKIDEIEDK